MKGTDFYKLYKELEAREKDELIAAVQAHGGEYVFFDCASDNAEEEWEEAEYNDTCPIVLASFRHDDSYSDFYVTCVKVTDDKWLSIYGIRKEYPCLSDEDRLDMICYGQIHNITEEIPETEKVKDVASQTKRDNLYNFVCNLSKMLGEIANHDDMQITEDEIQSLATMASEARDIMEN